MIRDVTRRRQLESALADSEVRYRTLFESAGDAIAIHKNSRTIDCNHRLCELYDISRDERKQLEEFLSRLDRRRAHLEQQREDIEVMLNEINFFASQCRRLLKDKPTAVETKSAA